MILLSLIIPVFNKKDFIADTLKSIVDNHEINEQQFECILVDEESNDGSELICQEFVKTYSYFKYIRILNDGIHKPSNARNNGIRYAIGKYIMFLDSDDLLINEHFVSTGISFLENNKDYDIYIGNFYEKINNNLTYYYPSFYQNDIYGSRLSCCLFRCNIIKNYIFENIKNEDITYTKNVILNHNYYYDNNNPAAYIYNLDSMEMCIFDALDDENNYWTWHIQQNLSYNINYKFFFIDKNNIIEKNNILIQNIDYHLSESCNLNCAYCNHFSPLVKTNILPDADYVYNDLIKLSKFKNDIRRISLLGGEPTLNQDLNNILNKVRELFPYNEIVLITNGLTYKQLYKWKDVIIKNHITIHLSIYPISNSEDIVNTFKTDIPENLLILDDFPTKNGFTYKLLKESINTDLVQIINCPKRYECLQYKDGKLYLCHYIKNGKYVQEYFGNDTIKINFDQGGYIEINENTTLDNILNFRTNEFTDVCYHCNDVTQYNTNINYKFLECKPWHQSNKTIDEFYEMNV